jgi:hypothetical protein
MQSFDIAKMIITESIGNQIIYRMPEARYQEMKKFLEGQ